MEPSWNLPQFLSKNRNSLAWAWPCQVSYHSRAWARAAEMQGRSAACASGPGASSVRAVRAWAPGRRHRASLPGDLGGECDTCVPVEWHELYCVGLYSAVCCKLVVPMDSRFAIYGVYGRVSGRVCKKNVYLSAGSVLPLPVAAAPIFGHGWSIKTR